MQADQSTNTIPPSSTRFFKSCFGVFQGGGCRASALAGCYKAAVECGVTFAEVAGTSAGSIVAALVGARAEPAFVITEVGQINFKSFQSPPEHQDPSNSRLLRWMGSLLR